jgi:hypothetical protein
MTTITSFQHEHPRDCGNLSENQGTPKGGAGFVTNEERQHDADEDRETLQTPRLRPHDAVPVL